MDMGMHRQTCSRGYSKPRLANTNMQGHATVCCTADATANAPSYNLLVRLTASLADRLIGLWLVFASHKVIHNVSENSASSDAWPYFESVPLEAASCFLGCSRPKTRWRS